MKQYNYEFLEREKGEISAQKSANTDAWVATACKGLIRFSF